MAFQEQFKTIVFAAIQRYFVSPPLGFWRRTTETNTHAPNSQFTFFVAKVCFDCLGSDKSFIFGQLQKAYLSLQAPHNSVLPQHICSCNFELSQSQFHCNAISGTRSEGNPVMGSVFDFLFHGESVGVELLWLWPNLRIVMDCINGYYNQKAFWNVNAFELCTSVALSL